MIRRKDLVVLVATSAAMELLAYRQVSRGLRQAMIGWRHSPARMASQVVTSFITGQCVFWLVGSDQIGLFMNPVRRFGIGPQVGRFVNRRLPDTAQVAWAVKGLEIATDAARMPIEGSLYHRHGIVPDAVAVVVTQPAWTALEVAEKVSGAVLYPSRVQDPEQVQQSLANIYGSLFRFAQAAVLWKTGESVNRHLSSRVERAFRSALKIH